MLSKRENALIALRGEKPEYVPCFFDACQIILSSAALESPPMFQGPGVDGYGVHQTPTESASGMFTPTPDVKSVLEDVTQWKSVVHFPDYTNIPFKTIASQEKEALHLDKEHCCGKMEDLLDDFLDIGITAFDPVQPVNNISEMKKKTFGKAGIMGGLDVQNIVDRAGVTDEELEAEAKRCIETYGEGGGYMIYGASLHMYNPKEYAPGGKLFVLSQAVEKYGKIY